jgi:hypothetical protein
VKLLRQPWWLFFVIAVVLRCGFVVVDWGMNGAALSLPDERLHLELAQNLLESGTLISDDGRHAARMPLYPAMICYTAWMREPGIFLFRLTQAAIGALTVFVAVRLAELALGRNAAICAGVLTAFDPFAIYSTKLLLNEVAYTFLLVAFARSCWQESRRMRGMGLRVPALVGWIGTMLVMTRPEALGLVIAALCMLPVIARNRGHALRAALVAVLMLTACLVAWGARNERVIGKFVVLTTNGGITLYDGNGPQADGSSNQDFLNQIRELDRKSEVEIDEYLQAEAIRHIREDPARFARLAWQRLLRTWNLTPNNPDFRNAAISGASAGYTGVLLLMVAVAILLAVTRRLRSRQTSNRVEATEAASSREHWRFWLWLALPILYTTLTTLIYVGSVRYRVPLLPLMALLSSTVFIRREPTMSPYVLAGEDETGLFSPRKPEPGANQTEFPAPAANRSSN